MLQSKTRSQDLKTQSKVAMSYILKAVGVISKVTDTINDNKPEKQHISKP